MGWRGFWLCSMLLTSTASGFDEGKVDWDGKFEFIDFCSTCHNRFLRRGAFFTWCESNYNLKSFLLFDFFAF